MSTIQNPGNPVGVVSQKAITVGTSAVRLTVSGTAPSNNRILLMLEIDSGGSAKFYIGGSTVTATGSTRGVQVTSAAPFVVTNDGGDYWIVSDTASQTVYVMEQT